MRRYSDPHFCPYCRILMIRQGVLLKCEKCGHLIALNTTDVLIKDLRRRAEYVRRGDPQLYDLLVKAADLIATFKE